MNRRMNGIVSGLVVVAVAVMLLPWVTLFAQERMPPLPHDKMTDAQKKALEDAKSVKGLGSNLDGPPFYVVMRVPELVPLVRDLRNQVASGPLKQKLAEMAILITAREWTQNFEWGHTQGALTAGVPRDIITSIADGRRPLHMAEDEEILYDFSMELLHNHSVSDATYARALTAFGEPGIVEIATIHGYYGLLSMVMNAARMNVPAGRGALPPLEKFPR